MALAPFEVDNPAEIGKPAVQLPSAFLPVYAIQSKDSMWGDGLKQGLSQGRTVKVDKSSGQQVLYILPVMGKDESMPD